MVSSQILANIKVIYGSSQLPANIKQIYGFVTGIGIYQRDLWVCHRDLSGLRLMGLKVVESPVQFKSFVS